MSRRKPLFRVIVGLVYFPAQIVIIPAILAVGAIVGIVTITNTLLFRKRSGVIGKGPTIKGILWIRDLLQWNSQNLHSIIVGMNRFSWIPPGPK